MTNDELKEMLFEPGSHYISAVLEQYCLNGDCYITEEKLYALCRQQQGDLPYSVFARDLREQISLNMLRREGARIYLDKIWRCEESAAQSLADISLRPPLRVVKLNGPIAVDGLTLDEEQVAAVEMALSNRLSMILGGAGSGKSTLIKAIARCYGLPWYLVCAPTGKAARNITERTGIEARTVHSACGLKPDDDFLPPVQWTMVNLVIVDEASMLTLELLAQLLGRAPLNCRIVLLGDPNQLQSVGAGNVIPDLLRLEIPHVYLTHNHRQTDTANALRHNVVDFSSLGSLQDLAQDDSFQIRALADEALSNELVDTAVAHYGAGESFQLITPYNKSTDFSVRALNPRIRNILNPYSDHLLSISDGYKTFRSGDRVLILNNDRERKCNNGDIGILQVLSIETVQKRVWDENLHMDTWIGVDSYSFFIVLPDGRCPFWTGVKAKEAISLMELAYVITVHKAQGSQYDTVLMPVSMQMQNMLNRNLFYTAISRASRQVLLYGNPQAVDYAMRATLPPRKSVLVSRVQMRSLENY